MGVAGLGIALWVSTCPAAVGQSATELIDRWVTVGWTAKEIAPAPRCDDTTFARRLHLSLVGRPPFPRELQTFLDDAQPGKRSRLVKHLLDSDAYAVHMAQVFDVLLMGRKGAIQSKQRVDRGWLRYLQQQFRENVSWEVMAQDILQARPTSADRQASTWFLFERRDKHQEIAEAIAPAFFGIRVECAQCHDHPLVDEIKQSHYWGLTAFFNRGKNQNTPHGPRIQESAVGGFTDFTDLAGDSYPNELVFLGAGKVAEKRPAKGSKEQDGDELYHNPEREGLPRVPVFSRREAFVNEVLTGHPLLARAMVNKIWAMMLGRGIVDPVDEMDSMHEASHPELLDALSDHFRESGYDVQDLLHAIAMSKPYQLSSARPPGVHDPATFAWFQSQPLTAEMMVRSLNSVVRQDPGNALAMLSSFRKHFPGVLASQSVTSLDDAMFLTNNHGLHQFLEESIDKKHIVPRLLAMGSHEARARHLYWTAFARQPSVEEVAVLTAYLEQREDKLESALRQVVWAVVTSVEFRFNH